MHERKGQEVEDRGGVQPTVQHDSGGLELEDIAGQCRMTRQTILRDTGGESLETHVQKPRLQLCQQDITCSAGKRCCQCVGLCKHTQNAPFINIRLTK